MTMQCSYFESHLHFVFLLVTAVCPRAGQRGTTTRTVLPRLPALCVLWSPRAVHGLPDQNHICIYCGMHGAIVVDNNPQPSTRRLRRTRFERLRFYYHLHKVTTKPELVCKELLNSRQALSYNP